MSLASSTCLCRPNLLCSLSEHLFLCVGGFHVLVAFAPSLPPHPSYISLSTSGVRVSKHIMTEAASKKHNTYLLARCLCRLLLVSLGSHRVSDPPASLSHTRACGLHCSTKCVYLVPMYPVCCTGTWLWGTCIAREQMCIG